jgi:APA family basic amino acid/polyamine antiporter
MNPGTSPQDADSPQPHLVRKFGLLQSTALNMSNMVGVGPFITIPALTAAMGGPQSMLGWVVGALIVLCDGQVWSELGAALPGSGGTYRFLRQGYGPERWGRAMAFLFIWQFVFSGPLEIASGMIGFGQYFGYIFPSLGGPWGEHLVAASSGALAILLLSRRADFMSRVAVTLWAGTVATMAAVVLCGLPHFSATRAFDFPAGAFGFSQGFVLGLGSATLIAVYNYMGYYDICYIGDEVRDPARVIPRSILISIVFCAFAYVAIHLVILGVVPWREVVTSRHVVAEFVERLYGRVPAIVITAIILWTAFASVFALLLGYSRIPYAAALDGCFFRPFARVHPTKNFPDVSLYVLGAVSIAAAFFSLEAVVTALMTTRVIVQFLGQIGAVELLRRKLPESARPYKMPFYPLPGIVAGLGWIYLFVTSGWFYVGVGLLTLVAGVGAFLYWARHTAQWPFVQPVEGGPTVSP